MPFQLLLEEKNQDLFRLDYLSTLGYNKKNKITGNINDPIKWLFPTSLKSGSIPRNIAVINTSNPITPEIIVTATVIPVIITRVNNL